jgi:hypothetical protein
MLVSRSLTRVLSSAAPAAHFSNLRRLSRNSCPTGWRRRSAGHSPLVPLSAVEIEAAAARDPRKPAAHRCAARPTASCSARQDPPPCPRADAGGVCCALSNSSWHSTGLGTGPLRAGPANSSLPNRHRAIPKVLIGHCILCGRISCISRPRLDGRALASPTTCRFIPALPVTKTPGFRCAASYFPAQNKVVLPSSAGGLLTPSKLRISLPRL